MRDLTGFAEWYCWIHGITAKSSENIKAQAIGIFKGLGINKNDIPKFLK